MHGPAHHVPADRVHFTWDAGKEPLLEIDGGDTIVLETPDVSDIQVTPLSTAAGLDLDWDRVYLG